MAKHRQITPAPVGRQGACREKIGLTVAEAAEVTGLTEKKIRELIKGGDLTNFGSARRYVVSRLELERLLSGNDAAPQPPSEDILPLVRRIVRDEIRRALTRVTDAA